MYGFHAAESGRSRAKSRQPRRRGDGALQILNGRYARGEIQKAEYEERKATILSNREP